jgi:hypothetical protein
MCDDSDPSTDRPLDRIRVKLVRGIESLGVRQIKNRVLPYQCAGQRDGKRGEGKTDEVKA